MGEIDTGWRTSVAACSVAARPRAAPMPVEPVGIGSLAVRMKAIRSRLVMIHSPLRGSRRPERCPVRSQYSTASRAYCKNWAASSKEYLYSGPVSARIAMVHPLHYPHIRSKCTYTLAYHTVASVSRSMVGSLRIQDSLRHTGCPNPRLSAPSRGRCLLWHNRPAPRRVRYDIGAALG